MLADDEVLIYVRSRFVQLFDEEAYRSLGEEVAVEVLIGLVVSGLLVVGCLYSAVSTRVVQLNEVLDIGPQVWM